MSKNNKNFEISHTSSINEGDEKVDERRKQEKEAWCSSSFFSYYLDPIIIFLTLIKIRWCITLNQFGLS